MDFSETRRVETGSNSGAESGSESLYPNFNPNFNSSNPEYNSSSFAQIESGSHKFSFVSMISFILGLVGGICGTCAILLPHSAFVPVFLYLMFISVYHMLEYLSVATFKASNLELDSFMFNPDGRYRFSLALSFAIIEFLVELFLFKASKSSKMFIILGQFIRTCAMYTAKSNFNHYIETHRDANHVLITHGIYSYERHPSYVGFFIWVLGLQTMLQNPVSLILFIAILGHFFVDRAQFEEYTLTRFFGQDYIRYKESVPTLIPFINST
ncbi:hypothetical protein BB560_004054 [Smittium megazygosporum]|uniref:Protein-S-isoprenylcysteine O-methyltransferase n=1 Tax=Smittium megazygosporum TaxID=133381 RepID=A0A2T9ZAD5_9FUNG|nr:hypothetical protein BB560_004054 [Smittium megazygosporum]